MCPGTSPGLLHQAWQPLEIKTNNNRLLIQTMAKDKHVGSSQPATASTGTVCFQVPVGPGNKLLQKKGASKRSAEARSSVTAEAIAAARVETEIMASQASGWKGAQPIRTLQLQCQLRRQTSKNAKIQRKI